jgi:cytochrome c1
MMNRFLTGAAAALCLAALSTPANAAGEIEIPQHQWSFSGIFGTYDRAALRRGHQVFQDVCEACHGLNRVAYRNLLEIGFNADEVKEIAGAKEVAGPPDESGEPTTRAALPSDRFVAPFANDNAARAANGGALPPDLSLITKARKGGADYLYALMTGYGEAPSDMKMNEGMSYNAYFGGHQIAMPAPLSADAVEYADGTKATVEQMAEDVTTFLAWAAEPEMERRKNMGIKVILFLIVLTALLFAVKRQIWSRIH